MTDLCPCCAPPWAFAQSPMSIATLGILAGTTTLSVYNAYDGKLRWTANVIRHNAGTNANAYSVCFGLNQRLFVLQAEFGVVGGIGAMTYLYEYDREGNFVAETAMPYAFSYGNFPATQLASNSSGMVAINAYSLTPRMYALIFGGNQCISPVNNTVFDVVDVDDHGYVYTYDGTFNIYRWDSSGAYVQTLTNPLSAAPLAMSVAPDGTYLWVASSILQFGQYTSTFKKVSIPGNTVLATDTTITPTRLRTISTSPWGTRYNSYGSENVSTGSQGGLQVKITGSTLTRNLPGESPVTVPLSVAPGGTLYGNAVSID